MFTETAALVETEYRQQRYLDRAAAHRLAREASARRGSRDSEPRRNLRLLGGRARRSAGGVHRVTVLAMHGGRRRHRDPGVNRAAD